MRLLARLRLCYDLLRARRARDWRRVVATCEQARSAATLSEILASIDEHEALEAERQQLLAGTRTTHRAEHLLREVNQLLQPKP